MLLAFLDEKISLPLLLASAFEANITRAAE